MAAASEYPRTPSEQQLQAELKLAVVLCRRPDDAGVDPADGKTGEAAVGAIEEKLVCHPHPFAQARTNHLSERGPSSDQQSAKRRTIRREVILVRLLSFAGIARCDRHRELTKPLDYASLASRDRHGEAGGRLGPSA